MKKTAFCVIILFFELVTTPIASAQGTLCVSNLDQTPTGSVSVGSDAWSAQEFYFFATGPNTYTLNSIQLLMGAASGNPNGFSVSIFSNLGGRPQSNLGRLDGSTDPSAGGIFTYSTSGITLSAGLDYFVVVTATTPVAEGAYDWSVASNSAANGWNISDYYWGSANGSSWTLTGPRFDALQMAIYATPIPEPETGTLFGLGLAALSFWRLRQTK